MRVIVLLLVARSAWATPQKPAPCAVAHLETYTTAALGTPLIEALEAKHWAVESATHWCTETFVDVTVTLRPAGKPWPADTRLTLSLGFDDTPVADGDWERWTKTLLADLDALWTVREVKRFRELVAIKRVDIGYCAGKRRADVGSTPPDRVGFLLIADASRLGVVIRPDAQQIQSFTTEDPAILKKVDLFVPGFAKRCKLHAYDMRVDYDGEQRIAKLAYNACKLGD